MSDFKRRLNYGEVVIFALLICLILLLVFTKNIIIPFNKNMTEKNTFVCVVNCMDGRVQDAVKNYMKRNYGADYVDMVTEPGPNKILAENKNFLVIENIKKRVEISVHHHGAKVVAVVGHYGCAGNPVEKEEQIKHLKAAKKTVESFGFDVEIISLWVDEGWQRAELID